MSKTLLVTGAAGFIGNAAVHHFASRPDWSVIGIDNMSRPTCRPPAGAREFYARDLQEIERLILPRIDAVIHLAAQPTVTRSYTSPWADWESNVNATLALVRFLISQGGNARVLFSSSNKVYGELCGAQGPIPDHWGTDPKTPYGVSKYVAEMILREHYGNALILRQSCIYSADQVGTVDQGWVAHVARQIAKGRPVVCYGDGTQVRDLLHVDSLMLLYSHLLNDDIFPTAIKTGPIYNVGGGEANAVSFSELVERFGGEIARFEDARRFDQRYFVSLNEGVTRLGWQPMVLDPCDVFQLRTGPVEVKP